MSYAAATPDHDTNAKPLPHGVDPLIARMAADLLSAGSLEVVTEAGADTIEAARVLLMNQICEPVTVESVPGGIVFRRQWAKETKEAKGG